MTLRVFAVSEDGRVSELPYATRAPKRDGFPGSPLPEKDFMWR